MYKLYRFIILPLRVDTRHTIRQVTESCPSGRRTSQNESPFFLKHETRGFTPVAFSSDDETETLFHDNTLSLDGLYFSN